jgi:hypothetical protein
MLERKRPPARGIGEPQFSEGHVEGVLGEFKERRCAKAADPGRHPAISP